MHGKAQCTPQMADLHPALLLNLGFGKPLLEHPDVDVVEAAMEPAMEHVFVFPKRNCEYWLRGAQNYFPVPGFRAPIS
jgi:hypothetical protein